MGEVNELEERGMGIRRVDMIGNGSYNGYGEWKCRGQEEIEARGKRVWEMERQGMGRGRS